MSFLTQRDARVGKIVVGDDTGLGDFEDQGGADGDNDQERLPQPRGPEAANSLRILRFFGGRLKPKNNWGAALAEAFEKDFGPDC